jgi:outer membrane protein OmpA-like peptidoglycan-associated protein
MRTKGWLGVAFAACLLAGNVGCSGEVQLNAGIKQPEPVKPPPPPPPADADGDGVLDDGTDKCVGEKEDNLTPDPKDGCKSSDPDGDGILADADKCPAEAENKNSFQDEDGCPDVIPKVAIVKDEVKITDKILFAFARAEIDKSSEELIKTIAQVIKDNPQVEFVEVAGHADKVGDDVGNVTLTKRRAEAVVKALVALGVDRNRVRAAGYGRYCPIDAGDTDEAREKNRRVEFKIMRMNGKDTGVPLGCAEAVAKGIKPAGVPATAAAADKKQGVATEAKSGTEVKPAVEAKPADKKPAVEAKPADTKAGDTRPAADTKPSDLAPKK